LVFGLESLLAVVGGVSVGLLTGDAEEGTTAGLAALVGGLLVTVLGHLSTRASEDDAE
jgi:hypothetical protein